MNELEFILRQIQDELNNINRTLRSQALEEAKDNPIAMAKILELTLKPVFCN